MRYVSLASWVALVGLTSFGCSTNDSQRDADTGEAGAGGESGSNRRDPGGSSNGPTGGSGGRPSSTTAGSPSISTAGAAGAHTGPICTSEDLPDDDFEDSNCDGIDGDVSRAIFVAPSGEDTAMGTREAPVATLTKAIELARDKELDVYLCNATYLELVELNGVGVNLYGGFDCEDWSRSHQRATVESPAPRALVISEVSSPVTVSHIDFVASDATEPGESSIAAFIRDSAEVTLDRCDFTAGNGADGETPDAASDATTAPPVIPRGAMSGPSTLCTTQSTTEGCEGNVPGMKSGTRVCVLTGEETRGGNGGDGGPRPTGGDGSIGRAQVGAPGLPAGEGSGEYGEAGARGAAGGAALEGFGTVTREGYQPTNVGIQGATGETGSAGGGGDGSISFYRNDTAGYGWIVGGGGGLGGYPGCGGLGGDGGGGGGASIAVLVIHSGVSLPYNTLQTQEGGAGAAGAAGGKGEPGGSGTSGGLSSCGTESCSTERPRAQRGGNGGAGGPGGPGGPGGGGPSVPLVSVGGEPALGLRFDAQPGEGGEGGPASGSEPGAKGLSQNELHFDALQEEE